MQTGTADTDPHPAKASDDRLKVLLIAATIGLYFVFGYIAAINTHGRIGLGGAPLFYDFSAFYQASEFADSGRPAAAYDDRVMIAAEHAAIPGATLRLPWNYPPTFELMVMPLAAFAYVPAWLLWSGAFYGLYALLARPLVGAGDGWIVLLAPGAAVTLFVGQNSLLSTALMGGGVLMLGRRPILGGALLGLLTYKPHLAILMPLVLICGREWRALAASAASAAALALLAAAVLGVDPWLAFLHKAAHPAAIFSSSSSDWRGIPSVMIMARSLGVDPRVASALHWGVAAAAAIGAFWTWRRTSDARIRAGVLAAAAVLGTPYLWPYDLALLTLPIAALMPSAEGWRGAAEKAAVLAAWALPAVLTFTQPPFQFGPIVSAAVMALVVWRAARPPGSGDETSAAPERAVREGLRS